MFITFSGRRKHVRLLKEHREQHKEYVTTLEKRNAILENQNKALKDQIKKLISCINKIY